MGKAIGTETDNEQLTTQGAFPSEDDLEFVGKVHDWWAEADEAETQNLQDEKDDHAFALGHQWDAETIAELEKTNRAALTINKTLPTILVVSGHERANRMRVRYMPVEQGDDLKAEVWSEVARIVQEQSDTDFHKSNAYMDMLKGGRGFLELRVDFKDNSAGDIKASRVLPWEIRIDSASNEYDLTDARYVLRAKDVSYEVLLDMWPEKSEQILQAQGDALSLNDSGVPIGDRDSDYDSSLVRSFNKPSNTWKLIEAWYWQVEKDSEFRAQNPQTGQWEPIKDKASLKVLLMQNPLLNWERQASYKKQYYQAFVVGPILLENHPSPYQYQGFPYIPIYGIKDEDTGRYVGMVHAMRDPQMELNKRRTQVLHILNQSAKSGWYGPKGSFVDRDQWEEESAKPGVVLEYDINVLQGSPPPQQLTPPPLPQAFIQLEQMATVDLRDVSGVNIELMGLSQKDTPGIVTNQRQRQALTILQNYFDNLKLSTKLLGRLMLALMQQYYTDGRQYMITGVTNPQTQRPLGRVQLTQDLKVGRYDLIAEESPYSPNQRMETAIKLQEVANLALQAGIPIPPEILDYLDLPTSFTDKWKAMLQQRNQAAQQPPPDPLLIEAQTRAQESQARIKREMELHQLEIQQKLADIKKTESETIKNLALAEAAELGPQMDQYKAQMASLGQAAQLQQQGVVEAQRQQAKMAQQQAQMMHQRQLEAQKMAAQPPGGPVNG